MTYRLAKIQYFNQVARRQDRIGTPLCERCCERLATDIHHKKGRLGALLTDLNHFAALCTQCHYWVEHNRTAAIQEGWLESRHT